MKDPKMSFMLRGFSQVREFRVFAFEGIAEDRTRTAFTVRTNLDLMRRYGIRLQELPLLCRAVLEKTHEAGEKREFTFTEEDMRGFAAAAAAQKEAAKQKKHPRPPVAENVGAAWRTHPR